MTRKQRWTIWLLLLMAVVAGGGYVGWVLHSQQPESLLARLASGKGDKQELMMRLNVARGDVTPAMIRAYSNHQAPAEFRADVLELLFKRNLRAKETAIEQLLLASVNDGDAMVRRRAVFCLAAYGEGKDKVHLVAATADSDAQVRRLAYEVFTTRMNRAEEGIWQQLNSEQRKFLVQTSLAGMKNEPAEEDRELARTVIGREIEVRGVEAMRAEQSSDLAGAEQLLLSALALDGENMQAQVRLMRHYLRVGQKEKAVELARRYGAWIEVPQLSQAPTLDGDPTDEAWKEAWHSEQSYLTVSRYVARPAVARTNWMLGHREGSLYVCVIGYEKDTGVLSVHCHERGGPVYADDCVEIILDPANTGTEHYQFAINPANALFERANDNLTRRFNSEHATAVFPDRGYWCCEFAIPAKEMDNRSCRSGDTWGLNVYRYCVGGSGEHVGLWPAYGGTRRTELLPLVIMK